MVSFVSFGVFFQCLVGQFVALSQTKRPFKRRNHSPSFMESDPTWQKWKEPEGNIKNNHETMKPLDHESNETTNPRP